MREYFMESERIGFSKWMDSDLPLARQVWGDKDVTRYICATGSFTKQDIMSRLNTEIENAAQYQVQYWPIFERSTGELIGCCGLRPFPKENKAYEIGFHLRKAFWGRGFAAEAAHMVIKYAFHTLHAEKIYAGHHPQNAASKKLLLRLGFTSIGDRFYAPTGLKHPSYKLCKTDAK